MVFVVLWFGRGGDFGDDSVGERWHRDQAELDEISGADDHGALLVEFEFGWIRAHGNGVVCTGLQERYRVA